MAKQKQTRYHSEAQLIALIDSATKKHKACFEKITELQKQVGVMRSGTATLSEIREVQDEIDKLFRKSERLEKRRLPKLKEALASFRTVPFAFVGEDRAVVLP